MAWDEALMKWEKDADRLNILKLPAPFSSSVVGYSVGNSTPYFSPLPIECGHGISLTHLNYKFRPRLHDAVQNLPCLADIIGFIEETDSSRDNQSGTSIYRANSKSSRHCTNTAESSEPDGVTSQCRHEDSTEDRLCTLISLASDIMERDTILGKFQSLEEAVNTIYTSTLQDNQVAPASIITPRLSGAEVDTSLIVGMSGLHIQKQKRGRAQRPSLVEDLLNPTTESQCKDAQDNELWTAIREAHSLSATPIDEEPENFVGWRMGRQDIKMSVADSVEEFLSSDIIHCQPSDQGCLSPEYEGGSSPRFGTVGVTAGLDTPCLCRICERSLCISTKDKIMAKQLTSTSFERPLPTFEVSQAQTEVNFTSASSGSPLFQKQAGVCDVPLPYERVEEGNVSQTMSSSHLSQKKTIIEDTVQHGSNQIGRRERKTSHTCDGAVNFPGSRTTTERELATLHHFREWQDDLSRRTLEGAYISMEEDAELEPIQPARKNQKFSHDFEDTSYDTDSTTTVTNSESTDPESDGDLSADEDSRDANNGLMLLAIAASLHQKR